MKIYRNGIIIFTNNYYSLKEFYVDVFGADILFENISKKEKIVCLDIGKIYLMIESFNNGINYSPKETPNIKMRFNISNIQTFKSKLETLAIKYKHEHYEWGESVDFKDSDGNLIGIRDNKSFENQIKNCIPPTKWTPPKF